VESHERPSGSSRSRGRSRTGSEQARMGTLPKNLIGRLSRAGSLGRQGSEATAHASSVRAKLALGMAESSNTEGEERDLLSRSTCLCQRRESSYIGAEERRGGMNLDAVTVTVTPRPRPGVRVWHALLLLPTSQMVHRWSTL
jgi:hypothetical protein